MSTIDTTKSISKVTVDGVKMELNPKLQAKTATQNGLVVADTGYDGLSSVNVNVSSESGNKLAKLVSGQNVEITAEDLGDITEMSDYAFYRCINLTSITIPNTVTSVGEGVFLYCSGLTSATVSINATSIGNSMFQNCSSLSSIIIPDKVVTIEASAFYKCSSLTSITIPDKVTSIGWNAFFDCNGLTSITIPDSVTSIGRGAFDSCSGLTSVTIGNGVTSIENWAFDGCSSLTTMIIKASTPPTLSNTNAISTATTTIYVPLGSKSAYESATNWSALTTRATNPVTYVELSE